MKPSSRTTMLITALVLLLLGLVLVIWPEQSVLWLCYAAGTAGILYGLIRLTVEWCSTKNIGMRSAYVTSVLALLIGILFVVKAKQIVALICTLAGIIITFDAFLKLEAAFRMKSFSVPGWRAYLIVALSLIALGLVLIFDPFKGAKFIVIVSGALLVAEALCWLWAVIALRGRFRPAASAGPAGPSAPAGTVPPGCGSVNG